MGFSDDIVCTSVVCDVVAVILALCVLPSVVLSTVSVVDVVEVRTDENWRFLGLFFRRRKLEFLEDIAVNRGGGNAFVVAWERPFEFLIFDNLFCRSQSTESNFK